MKALFANEAIRKLREEPEDIVPTQVDNNIYVKF